MVDFEYWLDNVVEDCELICNDRAMRRVWLDGDKTITSIHYYDELYEQLVGDLHLDSLIEEFAAKISDAETLDALIAFRQALHTLDKAIDCSLDLQRLELLLDSAEWTAFRQAANRVAESPCARASSDRRAKSSLGKCLEQVERSESSHGT